MVFGRPFVKRFALCYRTVVLSVLCVMSVTLVYSGKMVRWVKMKLSMQVGLGSGYIVLDGDPAPPKRDRARQFSAHVCGQTAGWIKLALGIEVGLGPGYIVLDGDPAPPPQKGARGPNFPPTSTVAKRLNRSRCHLVRR